MTVPVEALFERWRARRDAKALAGVFDATAPELWRRAAWASGLKIINRSTLGPSLSVSAGSQSR